jgi:hypothetical protein
MDPLQIAMAVMWTIKEVDQLRMSNQQVSVEEEALIMARNLEKVKAIKTQIKEEMDSYGG